MWIAVGIVMGIIVVVGDFFIMVFNTFVRNRNQVQDAWSNIDIMLKQRHDLIPNLVNTVKGYASHEKDTLEAVIQARNAAVAIPDGHINDKVQAEGALQNMLGKLFALRESYPDLKANQNFIELQRKLGTIEDDLEKRRRYYNGAVRQNNTYGETFPGVLVAGIAGYEHFRYFEIEASERQNVTVDFS